MSGSKKRGQDVLKTGLAIALLVVSVVVLINALVAGRKAPTPELFRDSATLDAAIERAGAEGRVVVAVAAADWCAPCQTYKRNALSDERVASWLRVNAVPVLIDVTDGAGAGAGRLGVRAIPATFVLDGHGEVLARREGDASASALLAWLEGAGGIETAGVRE